MEEINKRLLFIGIFVILSLMTLVGIWLMLHDEVSRKELQLIALKQLQTQMESHYDRERIVSSKESDAVSEKVAQTIIQQLKQRGKQGQEIVDGLHFCAAKFANKVHPKASFR